MSKFGQVRGNLTDAAFQQMQAAVAQAIENYDFDSGWVPVPPDNRIEHGLGKQPLRVVVYESADQDGEPFAPCVWTSADRNFVTVGGTLKYRRVLVDI